MDVISSILAGIAGAGAFVTAFGALKLKVLDRIQAESIKLEEKKTANERYYRELAEAENKRLLEAQNTTLDHLELIGQSLKNFELKLNARFDEVKLCKKETDKQHQQIEKLAKKVEKHCKRKIPRT